ncbi:PepSY domain-containing protein [Sphingorhabdus sp. Alg239-R122]|uniref:PepSY domain-containing protein n=1 Tax=Sphingorhabdus sp. Alg239-R122 TaxID=2305989 RepID=UPI0013DCCFE3|nr:PepSY domain-containing protein [Sphingorhabdus sp. Alg239-R122]
MKFSQALMAVAAATAMQVATAEPAQATGKIKCEAGPQSGWVSREKLEAELKAKGWKIKKSKVDGGCYEVYGTTPKGDRVEAYFHPVTMEKLLVSRRGKVIFRKKG